MILLSFVLIATCLRKLAWAQIARGGHPTCHKYGLRGGGGFFLLRGFGGKVRRFIPRLRFLFCFEVEISSTTLIPLFTPGSVHSGSAS